ncbi:MAG: hypothetical protein ACMUEL_04190 [Flavobacteriales bacterium Tduv]
MIYKYFNLLLSCNVLTTLCRFRNEIVSKKEYERLLIKINKKLEMHQAIVKKGVIVDTSIKVSRLASKEDPTYVVEDRKEEGKSNQSKKSKGKKKRLNQE